MEYCKYRDEFCMICGLFTPKSHNRTVTPRIKELFDKKFSDIVERCYIPKIVCISCYTNLIRDLPMR